MDFSHWPMALFTLTFSWDGATLFFHVHKMSRYLIWGKQNSSKFPKTSRDFPSPGAQKCWSPAQTLPPVMWPRGCSGCTLPCQKRQGLQFIGRILGPGWINGCQISMGWLGSGRFVWTCRVHWYDYIYNYMYVYIYIYIYNYMYVYI